MRNQFIAILLMTGLVIVWFKFFMPQPQPVQQQPVETPQSQTVPAPDSPLSSPEDPDFLPPVAAQDDPANDEVVLENLDLRLVFTSVGARLKKAQVKLHVHGKEDDIQLVPVPPEPADPDAPRKTDVDMVYPLGLEFTNETIGDLLDVRRFEVVDQSDQSVTFELTSPGWAIVRKTFSFGDSPYVVRVRVDYENLADVLTVVGEDQTPAYYLGWAPNVEGGDIRKGLSQTLIWHENGEYNYHMVAKMKPKNGDPFVQTVANPDWIGVKTAYFVMAFKPEYMGGQGRAMGNPEQFNVGMAVPRFEVGADAVWTNEWLLYVGPSQVEALEGAWDTLPTAYRFFESPTWKIMNDFSKLLLRLLKWFYGIVPSYGVGIILLTLLVRGLMFPLTIKQMRSMKRMQMLGPELEKLKEQYADNAQELQKKQWEFYKERGVNPVSGCLPMFLQLPIFISLYRMLWKAFELRGAPFTIIKFGDYAWIQDLSQADHLLHLTKWIPGITGVPFIGPHLEYFNILPILGAVAMVLSTKLTPQTAAAQSSQQKTMMTIMPLFFGVICYKFASGLNLYILTSTVLGILQNKLIRPGEVEKPEKKPIKKKRHFYDAAQERKRRLAKDSKTASKQKGPKRPTGGGKGPRRPKK